MESSGDSNRLECDPETADSRVLHDVVLTHRFENCGVVASLGTVLL